MSEEELIAAARNTYGGSISAKTTSRADLIASLVNAAGGSVSASTHSEAEMMAAMANALGDSVSALSGSFNSNLAAVVNAAAEGGEGPEPLADINFETGSYTVGVTSYAVTNLLEENETFFTVFDTADIVDGLGLKGSPLGGTSIPGFKGPLLAAAIGTEGCSIVADMEIRAGSTPNLFRFDFMAADGSSVVYINFMTDYAERSANKNGETVILDPALHEFAQTLDDPDVPVAIRIGMTLTPTFLGTVTPFEANDVAIPQVGQVDWGIVVSAAIFGNGFNYLKRVRVYAPLDSDGIPNVSPADSTAPTSFTFVWDSREEITSPAASSASITSALLETDGQTIGRVSGITDLENNAPHYIEVIGEPRLQGRGLYLCTTNGATFNAAEVVEFTVRVYEYTPEAYYVERAFTITVT
jgi:hypothetical protein